MAAPWPTNRTLTAAAGWTAGLAVLVGLVPSLAPRWVELARCGLGASLASVELIDRSLALAALSLLPPVASSLVAAMAVGLLQLPVAGGRQRDASRATVEAVRRRESLGEAVARLALVLVVSAVAVWLERATLRAALRGDAGTVLSSVWAIAGRVGLRVGVGLLAIGLGEVALARMLRGDGEEARARRRRADDEVDPRVRAEVRRRQREAAASTGPAGS